MPEVVPGLDDLDPGVVARDDHVALDRLLVLGRRPHQVVGEPLRAGAVGLVAADDPAVLASGGPSSWADRRGPARPSPARRGSRSSAPAARPSRRRPCGTAPPATRGCRRWPRCCATVIAVSSATDASPWPIACMIRTVSVIVGAHGAAELGRDPVGEQAGLVDDLDRVPREVPGAVVARGVGGERVGDAPQPLVGEVRSGQLQAFSGDRGHASTASGFESGLRTGAVPVASRCASSWRASGST